MLKNLLKTSALFLSLCLVNITPCSANPTFPYCPQDKTVIFVNKECTYFSGTGTGSYAAPYNSLAVALAASDTCDVFYVFPGTYDAALESPGMPYILQDNQRLLGTTTEAFQRCADCPKPILMNTGGTQIVRLANNNEVSGFTFEGVDTSAGAISNNSTSITTVLITDNTFNLSGLMGATGVFLNECPNLQDVTVSTNQFVGLGISDHFGVLILNSGQATVTVTTNNFSNVAGCFQAANLLSNSTFSILNNFITGSTVFDISPISINNNSRFTPSIQATISANNIRAFPLTSGIELIATFGGTFCAIVNDNSVETPPGVPGYDLENHSFDGAFKYFDSTNLGTLLTNISGFGVTFPITYTQSCP